MILYSQAPKKKKKENESRWVSGFAQAQSSTCLFVGWSGVSRCQDGDSRAARSQLWLQMARSQSMSSPINIHRWRGCTIDWFKLLGFVHLVSGLSVYREKSQLHKRSWSFCIQGDDKLHLKEEGRQQRTVPPELKDKKRDKHQGK